MSRPPLPLPPEDRLPPGGNRVDEIEDALWSILELAKPGPWKMTEAKRLELIAKFVKGLLNARP